MFDFYERRRIKHWIYSWPTLVVLVIICIFLANGVWGVYKQERQTRINKNQRLSHFNDLKIRKDSLEEEINRLNTERGIEEEIRKKFEVAKEGEEVIVIVDSPENVSLYEINKSSGRLERFLTTILFWR